MERRKKLIIGLRKLLLNREDIGEYLQFATIGDIAVRGLISACDLTSEKSIKLMKGCDMFLVGTLTLVIIDYVTGCTFLYPGVDDE